MTEMITGQDLVAWQLLIADGGKIPLAQGKIKMKGHAIEARICAEDPADGFRPGAGLIEAFGPLAEVDGENVRWEAGFEPGDRVPSNYDSMIAKLVVHAETREAATQELVETLYHTQLVGVPENIGFLARCAASDMFASGAHHVNWISEEGEALTVPPGEHELASVLAVCDIQLEDTGHPDPWARKDGWRLNATAPRMTAPVAIADDADVLDPDAYSLPEDNPLPLVTDLSERRFAVTTGGDNRLVVVPDFDAEAEALAGGDSVNAPMPGKLLALNYKVGDNVLKGDVVAVMEAMKMEHSLSAPRDGVIEALPQKIGAQVTEGTEIAKLASEEG